MSIACSSSLDLDTIYPQLAPRLEQIVRRNLTAPAGLIEDACQAAWGALVVHREQVKRGTVLGWLATTAIREALRMLKASRCEISLEQEQEAGRVVAFRSRELGPEQAAEVREHIAQIRALPVRQQRMVWLHGLGYDYVEIAAQTGDSRRTVERQLLRAKHRLAVAG